MPMPVAHAAAGVTAYLAIHSGRPGARRSSAIVLAIVCVVLALLPDLDILAGAIAGDPHRFHSGTTHSLFLGAAVGVFAASLVSRRFPELHRARVFASCILAGVSHGVLDALGEDNSLEYGVELLWPLTDRHFIAPMPFFRTVAREGGSLGNLVSSLFNRNNGWGLLVELAFSLMLVGAILIARGRIRHAARVPALLVVACAALVYYSVQIEPRWISIRDVPLAAAADPRPGLIAHLSDLQLTEVTWRERRVREILEKAQPDVVLFSGDVFDPVGNGQKLRLEAKTMRLVEYIAGLPGEKHLVWGEGICDNRHRLAAELRARGVRVLEDESVESVALPGVSITGKLPELAGFRIVSGPDPHLGAGETELNTYLHYRGDGAEVWQDYEYTGEFIHEVGGSGLTFYSAYTRESDRFYRIRIDPDGRWLVSPHGAGDPAGTLSKKERIAAGRWHKFRIRTETAGDRTVVHARAWLGDEPEPNVWDIEFSDASSDRLSQGTVGVWVNGPGSGRGFDDLSVVPIGTTVPSFVEPFSEPPVRMDRWATDRRFTDRIEPSAPSDVRILLVHSPAIVASYDIRGFDLMLAGDTHGGQICWPTGRPLLGFPDLPHGWHSGVHPYGDMLVSVSRGIGTSRLPVRLFCRPEIVFVQLQGSRLEAASNESRARHDAE